MQQQQQAALAAAKPVTSMLNNNNLPMSAIKIPAPHATSTERISKIDQIMEQKQRMQSVPTPSTSKGLS